MSAPRVAQCGGYRLPVYESSGRAGWGSQLRPDFWLDESANHGGMMDAPRNLPHGGAAAYVRGTYVRIDGFEAIRGVS